MNGIPWLDALRRPRFTVQMALFSRRPRVGGLTVVTSGAENRLSMLDAMCATWVGPLAVAILLPVLAAPGDGEPGENGDGRLNGVGTCPATLTVMYSILTQSNSEMHDDLCRCAVADVRS